MKRTLAALSSLALFGLAATAGEVPVGKCLVDDQMPGEFRTAIQKTALQFGQKIVDGDLTGANAFLSDDARAAAAQDKSFEKIGQLLDQIGKMRDLKLEHVFFVNAGGVGTPVTLNCTEQYAVAARSYASQGYAVLSAPSDDAGWAISLWFEKSAQNEWSVRNFSLNMAQVGTKDSATLLQMARKERKSGHPMNAQMLYYAAVVNAKRGEILHLRVTDNIDSELAGFQGPDEMRDDTPPTWTLDGHVYTVRTVTVIGMKGKMGLRFVLPDQTWTSNDVAQSKCRAFIENYRTAHPEWRDAFEKLQVQLVAPDKETTFTETFTDGSGYDDDIKSGKA